MTTSTQTKKITIEVEIPQELAWLDERTLRGIARASLERRLFILKKLEELIPESVLSEDEILALDREVKSSLARRLEDVLSGGSSRHK